MVPLAVLWVHPARDTGQLVTVFPVFDPPRGGFAAGRR